LTESQDSRATYRALPGRLVPLGRKRRVTAERMAQSSRSVARITLNVEVDAGKMVELRARVQSSYAAKGQKLSYDALLVKTVGAALADHPHLNARWIEGKGIYLLESINVGVAVAAEDGLVVPVVRDAGGKKLAEIAAELAGLLAKARENRLTREEMFDGTFTITNLGMFGIDSFAPIVNPPESAILGVGRIAERPAGRDGQLVLRPSMTLSLSVDHRVADGAPAARFLQRVKELLEEPYLLL
jgi:pyruvate dehydrogenase E2 component (dihydrolipoamide acetyltransferase)